MSSVAGLSRFQNGRFTTLTTINGPFAGVVPTLVEDNDGYIWMGVNAGSGLMRFNPAEIDKVATNRSHEVEYRLYDVSDGLPGDLQWNSRPAAVRAGDGRLWLATRAGASVIDPQQLPRIHRPAPPRIDRVVVDGRPLPSIGNIELPARTSNLQVDYGTLSLSAATKLRYRYMLEGVNAEWVDAGARRQATFANVPPGRHRLRVSATNDGLWTEARFWDFSIAPPFYKTNRFYAICLISLLLALGSTWWLRLRAVQHQFSLVIAERARVSREIHDTLLQSLGAIGLELETIASQLDPSPAGAARFAAPAPPGRAPVGARGARVDHGAAIDEARTPGPRRSASRSGGAHEIDRGRAAGRRRRGQRPAAALLGGDRRGAAADRPGGRQQRRAPRPRDED